MSRFKIVSLSSCWNVIWWSSVKLLWSKQELQIAVVLICRIEKIVDIWSIPLILTSKVSKFTWCESIFNLCLPIHIWLFCFAKFSWCVSMFNLGPPIRTWPFCSPKFSWCVSMYNLDHPIRIYHSVEGVCEFNKEIFSSIPICKLTSC